jgi:cysteine desulfurase/selenocysteine lyase
MVMSENNHIYLDNAATSFPKPEAVYAAVDHYNRHVGAAFGRSAYQSALEVQGTVNRCRKQAAEFFGAESPERIIFTFNGTDSLNLALHGLLKPGDHVVTSKIEHNSVLRPLRELRVRKEIDVSYLEADSTGLIEPADVKAAIQPNTKLITLIHASNVTGTIQPIADVGEIAHNADALFLVDAAQSAGHLPIDLRNLPLDLLACPGHKGLLGPLGTGLLYIRPGIEEKLCSIRQGGTGSQSEDDQQPETLPDKYESGNHNAPGLYGLEAAFGHLQERGIESIRAHEQQLTKQLLNGLSTIPNLELFGPKNIEEQVGVVSISLPGFDPQVLSTILDENFSIQTRAGLHCAPGVHKNIGTFETGGTVRLSTGQFTSVEDIDAAVLAIREVAKAG